MIARAPAPSPAPREGRIESPPGEPGDAARFGRYVPIKRLAVGGMAEIFLARTDGPEFERYVVVKRIRPQLAADPMFVKMFRDEARIATTLQHPNLVQVFDVGVTEGTYFMAMEYLHGADLRTILTTARAPVPLEHALHIVISVCAGLHAAHEKIGYDGRPLNIIHRDVTPQNVMVTFDGGVKLLDFGIAKAANRSTETQVGGVKGKVRYLSPEQCRAEVLDRRTDVFALGILLYELTLGRPLFTGPNDFEIMKKIIEGRVPPPRGVDPAYPAALEPIVLKALATERGDRFATAQDLQIALEKVVVDSRLFLSPHGLQEYMERLFGHPAEPWRELASGPIEIDSVEMEVLEYGPTGTAQPIALERPEPAIAPRAPGGPAPLPSAPATPAPRPRGRWWAAGAIGLGALAAVGWLGRFHVPAPTASATGAPTAVAHPPADPAPPPSDRAEPAPAPAPAKAEVAPAIVPLPPVEVRPTSSTEADRKHHRHHRSSRSRARPAADRPAAPAGSGTLVLATDPWCQVSVDGVAKGPTPLTAELPAGPHTVLLTSAEFGIHRTLNVKIEPGETLRKKLDFAR